MASVRTCMLFLTMVHISAAFVKVDCQSENHGQYGQDSILKCVIKTTEEAADALIKVVTWKKDEKLLALFRGPQSTNEPRFSFSEQNFNGNTRDVSLIVSNTQIKDSGEYECMVWTDSGPPVTIKINLTVTAKYSAPKVSSIPETDPGASLTLTCNSEGGYPKGTIRWFQEEKELTSSSQPAERIHDECFNLTSTLKISSSSPSSYTCTVYNASGDKEGETTFSKPGTTGPITSEHRGGHDAATKIVAPVVVIGSLIVGFLIVLLLRKRRSSQGAQSAQPIAQDEEKGFCQDAEGGKKYEASEEMNTADEEGCQENIPLSAAPTN